MLHYIVDFKNQSVRMITAITVFLLVFLGTESYLVFGIGSLGFGRYRGIWV